ncbi:protein argonaute-3-like [Choristoneura fumiferana]|uniref:protein argonaute-3-like n=1 Tax=Choristoneura fumiferana TaxID=7141 RepID=UPI003D15C208
MKIDQQKNYFWLSSSDRNDYVVTKTLPTPVLQTGGEVIRPKAGSWDAGRPLQPATLPRWGFVVIEPDARAQADYAETIALIQKCGRDMGMSVAEPVLQQFYLQFDDLMNTLVKCKEKGVKLLFVVLPDGERDYYHKVKQLAERKVGILTQCLKEQTARRGLKSQAIKNILLKVNAKLMGVNHALHPSSMPSCIREPQRVMVVGGHVIHPTPEQLSLYKSNVPSIAAVTASIDPQCAKYNVTMSVQVSEKGEILDFENMMVEHLDVYWRHHKALPTTIIYFRNCMPVTLYDEVESYELRALSAAFWRASQPSQKVYDPCTWPKILFIVVQSPRNARLETVDWGVTWIKQKTTRPGIIIYDEEDPMSSESEMNFSMVSHQGAAATRFSTYHIYFNDGVPYTQLERLAYSLCYTCGRGPRSVSCPTPLYYARLACRRALSLTYGKKYPALPTGASIRLRARKSLLEYGRMFFV